MKVLEDTRSIVSSGNVDLFCFHSFPIKLTFHSVLPNQKTPFFLN